MKRLTPEVFERIRDVVERRAHSRNISGFMIIADLVTNTAMFALVNTGTALRIGVPGKNNANFASIAGQKFGMVFAHREDTGQRPVLLAGEVEWKGGVISRDGEFAYVFSGGPQEEDEDLMHIAEIEHSLIEK